MEFVYKLVLPYALILTDPPDCVDVLNPPRPATILIAPILSATCVTSILPDVFVVIIFNASFVVFVPELDNTNDESLKFSTPKVIVLLVLLSAFNNILVSPVLVMILVLPPVLVVKFKPPTPLYKFMDPLPKPPVLLISILPAVFVVSISIAGFDRLLPALLIAICESVVLFNDTFIF